LKKRWVLCAVMVPSSPTVDWDADEHGWLHGSVQRDTEDTGDQHASWSTSVRQEPPSCVSLYCSTNCTENIIQLCSLCRLVQQDSYVEVESFLRGSKSANNIVDLRDDPAPSDMYCNTDTIVVSAGIASISKARHMWVLLTHTTLLAVYDLTDVFGLEHFLLVSKLTFPRLYLAQHKCCLTSHLYTYTLCAT